MFKVLKFRFCIGLFCLAAIPFTKAQQLSPLKNKVYYSVEDALAENLQARQLNLRDQELLHIPNNVELLEQLQFLNLMRNDITFCSEALFNLSNLETLNLKLNGITVLPDNIGNLKKLIHLNISANKLKSLPNTIGNLKDLKVLYLRV